MKKIFLFIGVLSMSFLSAQDVTDALRYSQQDILGTARFRGMSGAFGALGGDMSAIQINPAGSAVFLNSSGSVTLSSSNIENDVSYFNGTRLTSSSNFNFNQVGAIFVYNNRSESSVLNKVSLGIAYDQTTDYADEFSAVGRSSNSIDSFFLAEAQGIPLDLLTVRAGESIDGLYSFLGETEGYGTQQAFLGHESFIIEANDLNDPNNTAYFSNVAPGFFDQDYYYESTGLNGKFTVNGGAQIHNNFYIGVNLNSHFINYDRVTDFFEGNNNAGSNINEITFINRLSTVGAGFSAQIGGIFKVSNMLRLGASLESPTWYYIEEETTQRLETFSDADGRALVNPDVVNIFPEYQLRTPARATGSIAVLFGKRGLISLDYSYKDYSSTEFDSDEGANFSNLNREIENTFQGASTLRIGGEFRNGNWSFRGGYSYEESPYKNELILGEKTGVSLGIGYNFGKIKFDVAYDYSEQERNQQFFPNSGFTNAVSIDNYRDNLTFTLALNL
ncbi:OmpP1/FadL family transporter [Aquimarina sp. 2201CG14-23]|uniref:OmpP1/FadL family transporter n=1 Tax=Aquimarina mycalae TaxID=3040073 RepID=UPI0024781DF8|nr:outer membrane protein transport protein [Aquimarina sp. 2201CG14-23]MDH7444613.1 outer membrane protein transport protein [Aquimarina sp. 2201CG14-23]